MDRQRSPLTLILKSSLEKLLQDVGAALKKRTKSGAVSTGKNVLKYLATQDDPIVKEVAEHVQTLRNANKLLLNLFER